MSWEGCVYNRDFSLHYISCHWDICPWMLPSNTHLTSLQVASTSVMREIKELRSSWISTDVTNHRFHNQPIEDMKIQYAVCLLVSLRDCFKDGVANPLNKNQHPKYGAYHPKWHVQLSLRFCPYRSLFLYTVYIYMYMCWNHQHPQKSSVQTRRRYRWKLHS